LKCYNMIGYEYPYDISYCSAMTGSSRLFLFYLY